MGGSERLGDTADYESACTDLHSFAAAAAAAAAEVAEEGIDVKTCQLIIRYDLPATAQVGTGGCGGCMPPAERGGDRYGLSHCLQTTRSVCVQAYIQSRGRARMRNSELLMLMEAGRVDQAQVAHHCCLPLP